MIEIKVHENEAGPREKSLLSIIQESRVPGMVTYHYERPEGYEAFARLQGSGFQVVEAVEEGVTLGFTQVTFDRVNWEGNEISIAYSGDTRVGMASRGKRISDALISQACSLTVPVLGAVMNSNSTVLGSKLQHWSKSGIHFQPIGELEACFYPPLNKPRSHPDLTCRPARNSDLPSMFALWGLYSKSHNLTRAYTDLDSFANDFPRGTSLETTLLVHQNGELIAMTGLWNQDEIRTIRVDSRAGILNFALSWIPDTWIRIPAAGEELKIAYSYRHAWIPEHPMSAQALHYLIQEARYRSGQWNRHFFCFGIDTHDPLALQARKGVLFSNRARIICDPRGNPDILKSAKSLHLEVGMG